MPTPVAVRGRFNISFSHCVSCGGTHRCSRGGGQTGTRRSTACGSRQGNCGTAAGQPRVSILWTFSREGLRTHHHRVAEQSLCDVQRAPEHLREVGHLVEEHGGSTRRIRVDDERKDDAREVGRHMLVPYPSSLGLW